MILLDFLFPNLHTATAKQNDNRSVYDKFYNDETLKISMDMALSSRRIYNMRSAFLTNCRYSGATPINYAPMRAKAIYERFYPKGGVIYDYSAGYGGRMLGALSSDYNFTYIGTDPNTETYKNLVSLGEYIEKVTKRTDSYKLYNECSENLSLPKESVDFAFSCPPYFILEKYCDEDTQSINKFPEYEQWLEFYVRPTIKNCYNALKDSGKYGVNISNFLIRDKKYRFVEDWLRIAQEEGFWLKGVFNIASRSRKVEKDLYDQDNIYIFTKNKNDESLNGIEPQVEEKKPEYYIAKYDIMGNLEEIYDSIIKITNYTPKEIKKVIKSKQLLDFYYYRKFSPDEEIPEAIEVKQPICKIENIYFYTCAETGRFLGVSRQAVAQAKLKKSKKIAEKEIIWLN